MKQRDNNNQEKKKVSHAPHRIQAESVSKKNVYGFFSMRLKEILPFNGARETERKEKKNLNRIIQYKLML